MMPNVLVVLCLVANVLSAPEGQEDARKLFGGYRITPKFCKPTRNSMANKMQGPGICMFNHECSQRNGQVVGACMDGFLFGACCQLPAGSLNEFQQNDADLHVKEPINHLQTTTAKTTTADIMSYGVSQITQTLLDPGYLPTAQDNAVVQINDATSFTTAGVTHPTGPETLLVSQDGNSISPSDFKPTTTSPKTTSRTEESSPFVQISISNAPFIYTPAPEMMAKPQKPSDTDKYVLVPTITHTSNKPNQHNAESESIATIIQMLNDTATTKRPTTYYTSTVHKIVTTSNIDTTTRKPPSTSYVFSSTYKPPTRNTTPTTSTTTTKKRTTTHRRRTTTKPATILDETTTTSTPLSTSYVYSNVPTRQPSPILDTHIAGPGFTVTSAPTNYPSPAPTVIVLGPSTEEIITTRPLPTFPASTYYPPGPRPGYIRPTEPPRKPVNSIIVNNHVTQNIYPSERPSSPTVLITPKPSVPSSSVPINDYDTAVVEAATSADALINFPPVRNPNLNMSIPVLNDNDITTPNFVEDAALNEKVESFVNKIIQGLQEPFEGLKDVVYNKNKTNSPNLIATTTKKPLKKQGTTTKKPSVKPVTTVRPPTTRRPTTRRPTITTTTKKPLTTTKKTKTTRKPTTTTESLIEDNTPVDDSQDYRSKCGIRPLIKTGRIVGGKGATFGEFPWQVLVRESTWLGLFTKNKCGGVLISNKYVMTAAHCQPGFLASLVAVFGEFDISGDLESKRPISRNVKRVIVHRQYDAATFENDLALLELEAPIQFDEHIVPICLPRDGEDFTGRMATVTGWGRLKYGGGVPSVLQEVQVPIMENHVCQEMFRTAGHSKVILDSFLCAGYANGQKDSCEGDSGGPLVLQRTDGRYQLAGTVSHGIKCAAPYLPGVYMRTTYYKPWIQSITGID